MELHTGHHKAVSAGYSPFMQPVIGMASASRQLEAMARLDVVSETF